MSNAWVTCPIQGDNSRKRLLIPHERGTAHAVPRKAEAVREGPASDQLVGGVTAHQGSDR